MKNFKLGKSPIAVVGMASLMPDAKELTSYWDNIVEKVVSIVDVPASRWSIDDYYDPDPFVKDKTYCKRGAFIPEIDFNPMEYGLPPNILEVTDVSQLLSLVVAKDVLEDSGIFNEKDYDHDRIGITLGIGGGQKLSAALTARLQYPVIDKVLKSAGVPDDHRAIIVEKYKKGFVPWEENSFPGLLGNVIAGRIANRFNFGGMNSVVDAACASSLSAMKMAVNELVLGHSDMMITGGACTDNSIFMYMSFSKTPAFTPDEFIQPFDIDSKGMMVGEGIGMIALKRLEDAERDGDRIYALIKGIGASSDGRFKSIYAPRPEGQAKALNRAYDQAGFEPKTIGLVEAHGTGTAAGDVAEFSSLNTVFAKNNEQKQHIALGSVKSQVGHLKAAAGAAGFMKCAMALHHKVLPPTASVNTPNPKLGINESPFYLNAETRPWLPPAQGVPRRAAVSAFGFGGTNFHFVLEEYKQKAAGQFRLKHVDHTSLIDAESHDALVQRCKQLVAELSEEKSLSRFEDFVEQTRLKTIPATHARLGFVSKNAAEAINLLELAIKTCENKKSEAEWELPQGVYYRSSQLECDGKLVALFSGQGSQYLRMGDTLAQNYPEFMEGFSTLDALFEADKESRISDQLFPIAAFNPEDKKAQAEKLQNTQLAQPCIGGFSAGVYKLMSQAGFKPSFVAGHSFGELTALWAAGVYSETDLHRLSKARGAAMAAPDDQNFDAGTMLAVVGDIGLIEKEIEGFKDVKVANYNSKVQVVLAGPTDAIAEAGNHLKEKGLKVVPLSVSAAFHTPLVGHAQKPFAKAIDSVSFSAPDISIYGNGSGKQYPKDAKKIQGELKKHILNSVRFKDEIENIYNDGGRVFVEFGPKNVLTKLVDNILEGKDFKTISVNASPSKNADTQLKQAAAKLSVLGVELQEIDPYVAKRSICNTLKPSPLNIKVSAAAYVSEKTRKGFDDCLEDGFLLNPPVEAGSRRVAEPQNTAFENHDPGIVANSVSVKLDGVDLVSSIEQNLGGFYAHQNETLRVHEKYLENPTQYAQTFQHLLSELSQLMLSNPDFVLPQSIERSLEMFNEQQGNTIKVHESFLRQQAEVSKASLNLMSEHYSLLTGGATVSAATANTTTISATSAPVTAKAPVVKAPVTRSVELNPPQQSITSTELGATTSSAPLAEPVNVEPLGSQADFSNLQAMMLDVVAEKTGYPTEMLELDMDMEADLGIDSIKRVEILGSVQEAYPDLPEMNPEALSELRTLAQIVDYMKDSISQQASVVSSAAPLASNATGEAVSAGMNLDSLTDLMLGVVAEKTGYPTDMLELDMDMEADLGIDSIKRVEILGAIQESYPDLPELDPEVLSELRTLEQIVEHIKQLAPTVTAASLGGNSAQSSTSVQSAGAALDLSDLTSSMLAVVAEKTGYPEDMLELDMDMEADLGIDSIKRVEILGAIQEQYPDLPEFNPEDMAELRTLEQIVDFIKAQSSSVAEAAPSSVNSVQGNQASNVSIDLETLTTGMLKVVAEKTGYPVDMLELEMDMEADLGIDSIKRVEILGSVQEDFPSLPELNPEELVELKTLGEIISYMKLQGGSSESAASTNTTSQSSESQIDVEALKATMLRVVSDKTGYPVDMLEMDMDMEADLGIDSIKRVEILGAMQEELPDLPEVDPESLAELRTLGQIVDSMHGSEAMNASVGGATSSNEIDSGQLKSNVVKIEKHMQAKEGLAKVDGFVERAFVESQLLSEPDQLLSELPKNKCVLITNDGSALTAVLAKSLETLGHAPVVLSFSGIETDSSLAEMKNVPYFVLQDFEESTIRSIVDSIEKSHGKVSKFIHLSSEYKAGKKQGLAFSDDARLHLRSVFLLAKLLKESLNTIEENTRNSFMCVCHLDGRLGYGKAKFSATSGGYFGLTKTLSLEWPEVFCRSIDLDASISADDAAKIIIAENADSNLGLNELGYEKTKKQIVRNCLVPVNQAIDPVLASKIKIGKDDVFLVSGGAKGVTAKCIIALAKQSQSKFVLLGRSEINESEPEWARSCGDETALKQAAMTEMKARGEKPTPVLIQKLIQPISSQREVEGTLNAINAAGAQVKYIACNVCDLKSLKKKLKDAQSDFGEITGLIHGAGVLADKLIEKKTLEDFESVYETKISGLANMLSCIDIKALRHFVMFSSAAGFFGNAAQSDYALANDILNKAALIVKAINSDCEVLSFNWGPWDGGMVTPQLKKLFAERGIDVIPVDGGAKLFVDYLMAEDNGHSQVLVGSSMEVSEKKSLKKLQTVIIERKLLLENNNFLNDHVIASKPVLPIVCAAAWMADSALETHPGFRLSQIEEVSVFNGIVFDASLSNAFLMEVSDKVFDEENSELTVKSLIFSERGGKRINHYSATLRLSTQLKKPERFTQFDLNEGETTQGETFYENGTLFHGEKLKLIKSVLNSSDHFMTLRSRASTFDIQEQGQFQEKSFDHFSMDALLQACLVWVREYKSMGSLPLKIGRYEFFQTLPKNEDFYISLVVNEASASKMTCDLICHDKDGNVFSKMSSAEVTISKQLDAMFVS